MSVWKIIGLWAIISILGACAPDYDMTIQVKKKLTADLKRYHSADVRIENDGFGNDIDRLANSGGMVVVFFDELERIGIVPAGDNPKLSVRCLFREGWGKPIRGRHGEIILSTIKWVNIKLIDIPTKRVIGEVECTRPTLKHLPPDFMKRMLDELISSRKEI